MVPDQRLSQWHKVKDSEPFFIHKFNSSAGARFTDSLMRAIKGEKNVVEASYVDSPVSQKDGLTFFSTQVELGVNGIEKIHPIGEMNAFEQKLYAAAVPELKSSIKNGVDFVAKNF